MRLVRGLLLTMGDDEDDDASAASGDDVAASANRRIADDDDDDDGYETPTWDGDPQTTNARVATGAKDRHGRAIIVVAIVKAASSSRSFGGVMTFLPLVAGRVVLLPRVCRRCVVMIIVLREGGEETHRRFESARSSEADVTFFTYSRRITRVPC